MKSVKVISLLLVFILVFSFNPLGVGEAADFGSETAFLKAAEVLDADFNGSGTVSKAQLTKIIFNTLKYDFDAESFSKEKYLFNDVTGSNPYYPYIRACKELNIISGTTDNMFYPDKKVDLTDMVTILINILGYQLHANAKGGYPAGYFSVAKEAGILTGVKEMGNDALSGNAVAKLIYNSLFADLVYADTISENGLSVKIEKGKNILSQRLGINEYDAVVTDDGLTSIAGEAIGNSEKIVLTEQSGDRIVAYTGNTDINTKLGSRVKAFVKLNRDTGNNEVVFYQIHKGSKEITLNADKIVNTDMNFIEYEEKEDSGRIVKYNLGIEPPIVIFNGVHITSYNPQTFKPADGFVKLIDRDSDNRFDVVSIISFNYRAGGILGDAKNTVVDDVDLEDGYVYCKYNPLNSLELNDDSFIYRFFGDGDIRSFSDLKQRDVISIAEAPEQIDQKTLYILYVSTNSLTGKILGTTSNELDIDGKMYCVSSSLLGTNPNYINRIKMNEEAEFLLDCTGKIAYIITQSTQGASYAYMINARVSDGVAGDMVLVKLFTRDAQMKTLYLSSKAIIDDKSYNTANDQYQALIKRSDQAEKLSAEDTGVGRPVIFHCGKEGYIVKIDTDTPNDTNYKSNDILNANQSSLRYTTDEINNPSALKAGFRTPMLYLYRNSAKTFEGKFYINNDTVVMNVPDIDTYAIEDISKLRTQTYHYMSEASANNNWLISNVVLDYSMIKLYEEPLIDENYKILTPSMIEAKYLYDIQAYDVDPYTGVAGLVVIRGRTSWNASALTATEPIYYFLRTTEYYDQPRERMVTKLYYTAEGEDEEFALCELDQLSYVSKYLIFGCKPGDTPYGKSVMKLAEGDMIRLRKKGNWLDHLERVIRMDNLDSTLSVMRFPLNSAYPYTLSTSGLTSADYPDYGMPYDVNYYQAETTSAPLLLTYVKSLSGGILKTCVSSRAGKRLLKHIDISDPSTYTEQFINISGVSVLVADYSGGRFKLRKGAAGDIVTVDQAGGINGASKVLIRHSAYLPNYVLVINGM